MCGRGCVQKRGEVCARVRKGGNIYIYEVGKEGNEEVTGSLGRRVEEGRECRVKTRAFIPVISPLSLVITCTLRSRIYGSYICFVTGR